jgi:hypothetical protein
MRGEIKYFVFALGLGGTMIAYAHSNFATKDVTRIILDRLVSIESKLDNYIINSGR